MLLSEALQRKKQILENASKVQGEASSYYENVQVETKHSSRINCGFFKVTTKIWHTYHNELRYNEGKFRKDLADVDATIKSILDNIDKEHQSTSQYRAMIVENQKLDQKIVHVKQEAQQLLQQTQEKELIPARRTSKNTSTSRSK